MRMNKDENKNKSKYGLRKIAQSLFKRAVTRPLPADASATFNVKAAVSKN